MPRMLSAALPPPEFDKESELLQQPPEFDGEIQHEGHEFYSHIGELVKIHERMISENRTLRRQVRISQVDASMEILDQEGVLETTKEAVSEIRKASVEYQANTPIQDDEKAPCSTRPMKFPLSMIGSIVSIGADGKRTTEQAAKEAEIASCWFDITMKLLSERQRRIRSHWEESAADSTDLLQVLHEFVEGGATEQTERLSLGMTIQMFIKGMTQGGLTARGCATCAVMEPSSFRRSCWSFASVFFMAYDAILLSVGIYQELDPGLLIKVFERVSLIFWTLDIAVSFRTGVYVDGELHMDFTRIAKHYIRSWFLADLFIVAPMWASMFFAAGGRLTHVGQVARIMKLSRYLRIIRLAKLKGLFFVLPFREWFDTHLGVLVSKIAHFFAGLFLWVHVSGCLFFTIGSATKQGWVYEHGWDNSQPEFLYFVSLHWAAAQLQGSVDIVLGTTLIERIYAVFAIIMSVIILATTLGKLTNIMIELQTLNAKAKQIQDIRRYLASNHISLELKFQVQAYLDVFGQWRSHEDETNEQRFLSALPVKLRRAINVELHGTKLLGNSTSLLFALSQFHTRCFERICCDALQDHIVLPDELLWGYGDVGTDMYFISGGTCFYIKYNVSMQLVSSSLSPTIRSSCNTRTLGGFPSIPCRTGTYVSEPVLWTQWTHRGDLISTQHCNQITLSETQFSTITTAYAQTRGSCANHAKVFVSYLNKVGPSDWSDLISTSDIYRTEVRRKFSQKAIGTRSLSSLASRTLSNLGNT